MHASTPKQFQEQIKSGVAILECFFSTHHRQPTPPEANQLLSQVQAMAGCKSFSAERLTIWFKRKIHSSFLSLSAEAIQHLTVLSESQSSPSNELVGTWAILLKSNADDIKAWLQYYKEQQKSVEPVQVPTPTNSASPEPFVKWEAPLIEHEQSECKDMEADINKALLDVFTCTTWEDKAPSKSPTNAQEFECMFAPYEQKMHSLLQISDQLANNPQLYN